ncbi:metal-dependent hydrolase [Gracilibacillus sp. D59]|uniref:metal-dependent hydrolase n=1 Tax=Gracilibacillus sp. D59 TaxID=3457434 RepID=UPI003FCD03A3
MTGKTHIMGGIAATTALTTSTGYDPAWFIFAGAIGGIIPDICHGGSKIGRKFPLLSKLINTLFGHRTFTHSLLFLLLIGFLLSMMTSNASLIAGIIVGIISHLLLDAATKQGIKLLYPVNITVRFPFTTKTGGTVENIVLLGLTLVTIYYGKDIVFSSSFFTQ